ncbi:MAG: hypothetical protein KAW12_20135 [Candidatus Aminicenantes bacterium]|nr:hypothetical protein [Candidatus Aminicenantes bacterium]
MLRTFEAIYENGRITPLFNELDIKKARVLVTVVEDIEEGEKVGIRFRDIMKHKGVLKNFPDGLKYQEQLRNEW